MPFLADLWITGHRSVVTDGDTIVVEDTTGTKLAECATLAGLSFYQCPALKVFTSPELAGSTMRIDVVQVFADGSRSDATELTLHFARSNLQRTPPPTISGDTITIEGSREMGEISVEWMLLRDEVPLFRAPRPCDVGEAESETFVCTYELEPPSSLVAPMSAPVRPAGLVLPLALPPGNYTAIVSEYSNITTLLDQISFDFNVDDPAPPPGPPDDPTPNPGPNPGPDDPATPDTVPIPLAPPPDTTPISDGPTPDEETTPEDVADETPTSTKTAAPLVDASDDVLRLLLLILTGFAILYLVGPRGMVLPRRLAWASASGPPKHVAAAGGSGTPIAATLPHGGEVDGAGDDAGRDNPFGLAWGDRSITWRTPGWKRADAASVAVPTGLSSRFPLIARVLADATYLRAALGVLWLLLPAAGVALGVAAASDSSATPLPPVVGITAALLVLAVLDSTAGIVGFLVFAGVAVSRGGLTADGLSLSDGVRGLLGLAALWFVTPLVAAAARPLRRRSQPGHVYGWDRIGDVVIAALVSGWAVYGIVGGLGDLTGKDLPITDHATALAWVAMAAVVGRYLVEELIAHGYPLRLDAVEATSMHEPTLGHQLRGIVIRAALVAFFAGAVIGPCWQLWVGVAIFAVPQLLALAGDLVPDVKRLAGLLPRGVVAVLVLVVVGLVMANLIDSRFDGSERDALRAGFVLLAIPGAALEVLGIVGGDRGEPRWTWPRQLMGAVVVVVTTVLVATSF